MTPEELSKLSKTERVNLAYREYKKDQLLKSDRRRSLNQIAKLNGCSPSGLRARIKKGQKKANGNVACCKVRVRDMINCVFGCTVCPLPTIRFG
ncbi:hypothetical protein KGF54_005108 [Candida jiufengensis]|uniref:uncharacterized protein n=1 Tax=Candida jiufengensis TaxID=497108 RepID=UPI0022242BE4|nr:uncharacterized protein KGF54_005108 [Candida jiufengensis]KAI5952033.1 hypothetical protein KGF54_005108 [Candida jiufengensis]